MENNKKILFDPGFAPIVIDYIGQVAYYCYAFSAIKDIKLKRINFPMVFKKIETCLEKNIAFYLGCLMWASYIKQFDDYEIEGNQLLGVDCEEEEYTSEINFLPSRKPFVMLNEVIHPTNFISSSKTGAVNLLDSSILMETASIVSFFDT